jgi:hypothetical protein
MKAAHKNVIYAMLEARGKLGPTVLDDEKRAKRIVDIYELADAPETNTQRCIDEVFLALCDKSLKDLLKYYEESEEDLKHVGQSGEPSTS